MLVPSRKTISFVSHCTVDFIDDLKLVALYYDKVIIPGNLLMSAVRFPDGSISKEGKSKILVEHPFIDDHYRSAIAILQNEGIVEVQDDLTDFKTRGKLTPPFPSDGSFLELYKPGYSLHRVNPDKSLTKVSKFEKADKPNIYQIDGDYVNELAVLSKNFRSIMDLRKLNSEPHTYVESIEDHLLIQMNRIVTYLAAGRNVLTTSEAIDALVKERLNEIGRAKAQNDSMKMNIPSTSIHLLKMYLPNISRLSISDLLEAKFRAKDELTGLSQKLNELEYELARIDVKEFNSIQYLDRFIVPQINDLTRKMKSIDYGLGARIIKELQNPYSYSPLLLSFADIPQILLVLGSLGLISATSLIEYSNSKSEIKSNGFHYLLKLRSRLY